jgi:D-3-phosphoglycerate dehydrogenase / 2-oxoglutarate reductase
MDLCFVSTFSGVSVRASSTATVSRSSRSGAFSSPVLPRPHLRTLLPLMVAAPSKVASTPPTPGETDRMSVLLPEKLSDAGVRLLTDDFNVVKRYDLTPETLIEEIRNFEAIIVRSATRVTREVIEASPKLKVIGRAGVGVDNIDLAAATERGVLVVNAPTGNCVAAAEHTIALMCCMARKLAVADATLKAGEWNRGEFVGSSLAGKTLGVVGLGRIGREVSMRAKGLGMNIVACDPFTSEDSAKALGVTLGSFEDVMKSADFLTLHIPLIDSTRNLIDAKAIASMKDNVRIINAARGGIIVEEALLAAIESGKVAGAALDCFEFEPPHEHPNSISAKLVALPQVLATPHLGASTTEAQLDVALEIANAVKYALRGDLVPTMVNAPIISPETLKEMKPKALLAERLGKLAFHLSGGNVGGEVTVTYHLPDPSEDTRLLRSGVLKGILESGLGLNITIVNADGQAKAHGLKLTEISYPYVTESSTEIVRVAVKGGPDVYGRIVHGVPHVTGVGSWELDLPLQGNIMAYSQVDRPGMMGSVGTLLGNHNINISSMVLARDGEVHKEGSKALVLLGVDELPSESLMAKVDKLVGDDYIKPLVVSFG